MAQTGRKRQAAKAHIILVRRHRHKKHFPFLLHFQFSLFFPPLLICPALIGIRLAETAVKNRHFHTASGEAGLQQQQLSLWRDVKENIVRVYPSGLRVGSSNYDPWPYWMIGAQMYGTLMHHPRTSFTTLVPPLYSLRTRGLTG